MSEYFGGEELEFDDIERRLAEAALAIDVPRERIEAAKAAFLAAADAEHSPRRRLGRAAGMIAAVVVVLGALGASAYAASDAEPGSALWSLRTAGWNLRLAFTSEEDQSTSLAEQAEDAAELAESEAADCDSKGVEVARKEALFRLERARAKMAERSSSDDGKAEEVLVRVEARLAELPPPGGPVCDEEGRRLGPRTNRSDGAPAAGSYEDPDGKAAGPRKAGQGEGSPTGDGAGETVPGPGEGSSGAPGLAQGGSSGGKAQGPPRSPGDPGAGSPGGGDPPGATPGGGKPDSPGKSGQ